MADTKTLEAPKGAQTPVRMVHWTRAGNEDVALCGKPLKGKFRSAAVPVDCVVCADLYNALHG